ncbi:MAG: hypothetical protein LUI10_07005 [Lachnospiraceae bacterium]|nr:hypothetical protein [Lachnospiraceae bacterium]
MIVALAGASNAALAVDQKDIKPGVFVPPAIPGRGLPTLTVSLNGQTLGISVLVNDAAVYRSATLSGRYRRLVFEVSPEQLKSGENVVELHNMGARIMYDTILLVEEGTL